MSDRRGYGVLVPIGIQYRNACVGKRQRQLKRQAKAGRQLVRNSIWGRLSQVVFENNEATAQFFHSTSGIAM
jgi:hypothetical protein